MKDFSILEKKINIEFQDKNLLTQAFVHRSYLNENPNFKLFHNERLEFLGDAVLELIVTEYLYKTYPEKLEGELTNWRAALVNARMLAIVAKKIKLNDFLLLSHGEAKEKEKGKARQYILADAFEALIGSIYLDQGYEITKEFIEKYLITELPLIIKEELFKDAKSRLQEKAQEKEDTTPTYKVLTESGPDHAKCFVIGVFFETKIIAKGEGLSKQEAEENAAQNALEIKGWLNSKF